MDCTCTLYTVRAHSCLYGIMYNNHWISHVCGAESVCAVLAIVWTKLKCYWVYGANIFR